MFSPNAEFDVGEMDEWVIEDSRPCKMNYHESSQSEDTGKPQQFTSEKDGRFTYLLQRSNVNSMCC